jgi:hypothetical protein
MTNYLSPIETQHATPYLLIGSLAPMREIALSSLRPSEPNFRTHSGVHIGRLSRMGSACKNEDAGPGDPNAVGMED